MLRRAFHRVNVRCVSVPVCVCVHVCVCVFVFAVKVHVFLVWVFDSWCASSP